MVAFLIFSFKNFRGIKRKISVIRNNVRFVRMDDCFNSKELFAVFIIMRAQSDITSLFNK